MKRKWAGKDDGGSSGAPPAYTKMLPTMIERVVINALELVASGIALPIVDDRAQ
jgi:hypothetical protein